MFAPCCNTVRSDETLVILLFRIVLSCDYQHDNTDCCIPIQEPRRYAIPLFRYNQPLNLLVECLAQIGQEPGEKGTSEHSQFRQIMSLKTVHLLAVFILVYVGVEVTVGGWIVTFIQTVRGKAAHARLSLH